MTRGFAQRRFGRVGVRVVQRGLAGTALGRFCRGNAAWAMTWRRTTCTERVKEIGSGSWSPSQRPGASGDGSRGGQQEAPLVPSLAISPRSARNFLELLVAYSHRPCRAGSPAVPGWPLGCEPDTTPERQPVTSSATDSDCHVRTLQPASDVVDHYGLYGARPDREAMMQNWRIRLRTTSSSA